MKKFQNDRETYFGQVQQIPHGNMTFCIIYIFRMSNLQIKEISLDAMEEKKTMGKMIFRR